MPRSKSDVVCLLLFLGLLSLGCIGESTRGPGIGGFGGLGRGDHGPPPPNTGHVEPGPGRLNYPPGQCAPGTYYCDCKCAKWRKDKPCPCIGRGGR